MQADSGHKGMLQNPRNTNLNENQIKKENEENKAKKKNTRRSMRNRNALNKLTILYQNVRGMKSKMESIQRIIEEKNPSIICYVESNMEEGEELKINGYVTQRNDKDGQGRGITIAYKDTLNNIVTLLDQKKGSYEGTWLRVGNTRAYIKIGVVYMAQENERKKIKEAYDEITEEIEITEKEDKLIICGDFNAKIYKSKEEGEASYAGKLLEREIKNHQLQVINFNEQCEGKWTREEAGKRSVIDYVLTKSSDTSIIKRMVIDEEKQFTAHKNRRKKIRNRLEKCYR